MVVTGRKTKNRQLKWTTNFLAQGSSDKLVARIVLYSGNNLSLAASRLKNSGTHTLEKRNSVVRGLGAAAEGAQDRIDRIPSVIRGQV